MSRDIDVRDFEGIQYRVSAAARENYWTEQDLAHRLDALPEARFCGFAGLNPHLADGDALPVCRICQRWDRCSHAWKPPAL